jgi:DNA repair protein RadC
MTTPSSGKSQTTTPIKLPYFVADQRGRYRARIALTEEQIIKAAVLLLNKHIERGAMLTSPDLVRAYLKTQLRDREHEVFVCLFLDSGHRVIEYEELFRGTIDGASVYPREVVKRCLQLNAAAVIFAHNHPSGTNEPSQADRQITDKLKAALEMIDVRVLDHFIIGDGEPHSFREHRLI